MSQKFLDLAGLTAYDKMIKEWFKSGVVDITDEAVRALFITIADGPADNEIWYTTREDYGIDMYESSFREDAALNVYGANMINREFDNCKGVITFDGPVTKLEFGAFGDQSGDNILKTLSIPNSIEYLGSHLFASQNGLTTIYFNGTKEQWNQIEKDPEWIIKDPDRMWESVMNLTTIHCTDGDITL